MNIRAMNIWIVLGGLNAALAVAAGAYGWHALSGDPFNRDIFMMGSRYQMWHALGLVAVGLMVWRAPSRVLHAAGVCFQVGIVLFSGTLYAYGGIFTLPVEGAAPVGGMLFMVGWLALGFTGMRAATPAA